MAPCPVLYPLFSILHFKVSFIIFFISFFLILLPIQLLLFQQLLAKNKKKLFTFNIKSEKEPQLNYHCRNSCKSNNTESNTETKPWDLDQQILLLQVGGVKTILVAIEKLTFYLIKKISSSTSHKINSVFTSFCLSLREKKSS